MCRSTGGSTCAVRAATDATTTTSRNNKNMKPHYPATDPMVKRTDQWPQLGHSGECSCRWRTNAIERNERTNSRRSITPRHMTILIAIPPVQAFGLHLWHIVCVNIGWSHQAKQAEDKEENPKYED